MIEYEALKHSPILFVANLLCIDMTHLSRTEKVIFNLLFHSEIKPATNERPWRTGSKYVEFNKLFSFSIDAGLLFYWSDSKCWGQNNRFYMCTCMFSSFVYKSHKLSWVLSKTFPFSDNTYPNEPEKLKRGKKWHFLLSAYGHWALNVHRIILSFQMEWKIKCRKHIFTHFSSVCSLLLYIWIRGLEFYSAICPFRIFRRVNVQNMNAKRNKKLSKSQIKNSYRLFHLFDILAIVLFLFFVSEPDGIVG